MGILTSKQKDQGSLPSFGRSNSSSSSGTSRGKSSRKLVKHSSRSSSRVVADMSSDDDHSDGDDRHEDMIDINIAMGTEAENDELQKHIQSKSLPKSQSRVHSDHIVVAADQFQSPRYHPEELQRYKEKRRRHKRGISPTAGEFSPGKGTWQQAHEYASQHTQLLVLSGNAQVSKDDRPNPPRRIISASSGTSIVFFSCINIFDIATGGAIVTDD